jgi:hypothetical protein
MQAYTQSWARYRAWGRWGAGGSTLGIISIITAALIDKNARGRPLAPYLILAILSIGVASLLVGIYCYMRRGYFLCPRCANFFSRASLFWPGWSSFLLRRRRCVHCRLELYSSTYRLEQRVLASVKDGSND